MTRRPKALVGAAMFVAVVASTQVHARQKNRNIPDNTFDQHAVVPGFGAAHHHHAPAVRRRHTVSPRLRQGYGGQAQRSSARVAAFTSRDCLSPATRSLLDRLEARFGRVALVKTCVPGARMPSGHVSWHARNQAFDFNVPVGVDKRDVMVWLSKNSPGVTISYTSMPRTIHTDTGTFHKVIYAAKDHEAGHRAVAIWMARATAQVNVAASTPLPLPRPEQPTPQPFVVASLGDDAWREEPLSPTQPQPVAWGARRDFWRPDAYIESRRREIVIQPWVKFYCPGGGPMPQPILALLNDSAEHFNSKAVVNSAYRDKAYNEALRRRGIRAAKNSRHIKCEAVDFKILGVSVGDLRRFVVANVNRWRIGGLGTYGTFIHADIRPLPKATKLVTWNGGSKKRVTRYAKHRKPSRYASAG